MSPFDVVHYFTTHQADLATKIQTLKMAIGNGDILWVSYSKGGTKAKIETDLNRDSVARYMFEQGLKAVTQISVDAVWSALRFKKV